MSNHHHKSKARQAAHIHTRSFPHDCHLLMTRNRRKACTKQKPNDIELRLLAHRAFLSAISRHPPLLTPSLARSRRWTLPHEFICMLSQRAFKQAHTESQIGATVVHVTRRWPVRRITQCFCVCCKPRTHPHHPHPHPPKRERERERAHPTSSWPESVSHKKTEKAWWNRSILQYHTFQIYF